MTTNRDAYGVGGLESSVNMDNKILGAHMRSLVTIGWGFGNSQKVMGQAERRHLFNSGKCQYNSVLEDVWLDVLLS